MKKDCSKVVHLKELQISHSENNIIFQILKMKPKHNIKYTLILAPGYDCQDKMKLSDWLCRLMANNNLISPILGHIFELYLVN